MLFHTAKSAGVTVVLASSRSLKILSSSEMLLPADLRGENTQMLPDWFIVRDAFSKKVFDAFPELKSRTVIAGQQVSPILNEEKVSKKAEKVLLVLLTHIKTCSRILLRDLSLIDFKSLNINKVFVRSHPAAHFELNELRRYFSDLEPIDFSGEDYNKLSPFQVSIVSGPTTAALEAVNLGAALFWAPYIWSDGILFDDFMETIGIKCQDRNELHNKLTVYLSDTEKVREEIKKNVNILGKFFYTPRLISEAFAEIISKTERQLN
jgi:hypothetical protein